MLQSLFFLNYNSVVPQGTLLIHDHLVPNTTSMCALERAAAEHSSMADVVANVHV